MFVFFFALYLMAVLVLAVWMRRTDMRHVRAQRLTYQAWVDQNRGPAGCEHSTLDRPLHAQWSVLPLPPAAGWPSRPPAAVYCSAISCIFRTGLKAAGCWSRAPLLHRSLALRRPTQHSTKA